MRITKEQLDAKAAKAQKDNSIGWLDTEKMNKYGVQTSQPLKLTGYVPKERMFQDALPQRIHR